LAALALSVSAVPARAAEYTTTPGPTRAEAAFDVSYRGTGTYRTDFHATPPNPGGNPDTNDAHDTSTQRWSVKFRRILVVPACGLPGAGGADPCSKLEPLDGARGPTTVTGRVRHTHADGLYPELDRSVSCRLRASPSRRRLLDVSVTPRWIAASQSIGVTVSSPVATALSLFPAGCPGEGDSIDRILDFYATPGFSFAPGFGSERWFASRQVIIGVREFHRSKTITIPLRDSRAGRPPRDCAVNDPAFERCRTGGSWDGVLTLRAAAAPKVPAAPHAEPGVRPPQAGIYSGRTAERRKLTLLVSGRSIDIVAFAFGCGKASARTSLNDLRLTKAPNGYRFAIRAHGIVSFSDDRVDENAAIDLDGRFSRTGRSVTGRLRVKAPGCTDTGRLGWRARR
jgi:hypothetical protein